MIGAAVGVHPHDATSLTDPVFDELALLAADPSVVAVGEIGLDYRSTTRRAKTQRDIFARLIALARATKKPIVVHTREAAEDTLALLASEGARDVGGVVHCFSEDLGVRAGGRSRSASTSRSRESSRSRARGRSTRSPPGPRTIGILVETDSPYLAPVPLRGKPCEPAYVVHTAARLAELRGCRWTPSHTDHRERRAAFRRQFGPL